MDLEVEDEVFKRVLGDLDETQGSTLFEEGSIKTLPLLCVPGIILFPEQILPLRLKMPNIINQMKACIENERVFAFVPIKQEFPIHVMGPSGIRNVLASVGTTSQIIGYTEENANDIVVNENRILRSGYLGIKSKGQQRFKLLKSWVNLDNTLSAQIMILPDIADTDPLYFVIPFSWTKYKLNNEKRTEELRTTPKIMKELLDSAKPFMTSVNETIKAKTDSYMELKSTEKLPTSEIFETPPSESGEKHSIISNSNERSCLYDDIHPINQSPSSDTNVGPIHMNHTKRSRSSNNLLQTLDHISIGTLANTPSVTDAITQIVTSNNDLTLRQPDINNEENSTEDEDFHDALQNFSTQTIDTPTQNNNINDGTIMTNMQNDNQINTSIVTNLPSQSTNNNNDRNSITRQYLDYLSTGLLNTSDANYNYLRRMRRRRRRLMANTYRRRLMHYIMPHSVATSNDMVGERLETNNNRTTSLNNNGQQGFEITNFPSTMVTDHTPNLSSTSITYNFPNLMSSNATSPSSESDDNYYANQSNNNYNNNHYFGDPVVSGRTRNSLRRSFLRRALDSSLSEGEDDDFDEDLLLRERQDDHYNTLFNSILSGRTVHQNALRPTDDLIEEADHYFNLRLEAFKSKTVNISGLNKNAAYLTHWPGFVYKQYDITCLVHLLHRELFAHWRGLVKTAPVIPVEPFRLFCWINKCVPIDYEPCLKLLTIDNIVARLMAQLDILKKCKAFVCKHCSSTLFLRRDVFNPPNRQAKATFVNPSDKAYEFVTVNRAQNIRLDGEWSNDFTWFTGYSWSVLHCRNCHYFLGWAFHNDATLVPTLQSNITNNNQSSINRDVNDSSYNDNFSSLRDRRSMLDRIPKYVKPKNVTTPEDETNSISSMTVEDPLIVPNDKRPKPPDLFYAIIRTSMKTLHRRMRHFRHNIGNESNLAQTDDLNEMVRDESVEATPYPSDENTRYLSILNLIQRMLNQTQNTQQDVSSPHGGIFNITDILNPNTAGAHSNQNGSPNTTNIDDDRNIRSSHMSQNELFATRPRRSGGVRNRLHDGLTSLISRATGHIMRNNGEMASLHNDVLNESSHVRDHNPSIIVENNDAILTNENSLPRNADEEIDYDDIPILINANDEIQIPNVPMQYDNQPPLPSSYYDRRVNYWLPDNLNSSSSSIESAVMRNATNTNLTSCLVNRPSEQGTRSRPSQSSDEENMDSQTTSTTTSTSSNRDNDEGGGRREEEMDEEGDMDSMNYIQDGYLEDDGENENIPERNETGGI